MPNKTKLPARPNLDHLRRQAKELLRALAAGEPKAAALIQENLPAARNLSAAQIAQIPFRLADAQSAIARQSGFAGWPHLARYIEHLRALEGEWTFERLEIDGVSMPEQGIAGSRILIDGDRFRTESPQATYEGAFTINVEADPHEIDIEFVAGPEAGNWNYGIYRLQGDRLELCLDLNGSPRPNEFRTSPKSGRAYEVLHRLSKARPENVEGGAPPPASKEKTPVRPTVDRAQFAYIASPTLAKLQGEWEPVALVTNDQPLDPTLLKFGRRSTNQNEMKVLFGGQTMVHALMRLNEGADPIEVDYLLLAGGAKGAVQKGLLKWIGKEVCFCMAAPDQSRPPDFECPPGSGRTLSQWRPAG